MQYLIASQYKNKFNKITRSVLLLLFFWSGLIYGQQSSKIIINPLALEYRFLPESPSRREAADPVVQLYKGQYYLFASKSGGYWRSSDLKDWIYISCKTIKSIEAYAPTVLSYDGALYFLASGGKPQIYKTVNPDEDQWEPVPTKFTIGMTDPAFFMDGNKKVYLYWGCSNVDPIMGVEVDPKDGFKPIGEPKVLIQHHEKQYGWEVQGEHNELGTPGWNEGPSVIKYKGIYYLQYASPGTQFRSYADGVYTSTSPLGPFRYETNSPFSYKPGGFIAGAGHGHTFQDKLGNFWHVATMKISVRDWFERRIGLFPAFFDKEGKLYAQTVYTDLPFQIPNTKVNLEKKDLSLPYNLLSRNKPIIVSSALSKFPQGNANDERVESWWSARSGAIGEYLQIDLEKKMAINALQVNFADQDFELKAPQSYSYQYLIEYSLDGKKWSPLIDQRKSTKDQPHELFCLDHKILARYVRITNKKEIPGKFSLYDFRIFGNGLGQKPTAINGLEGQRDAKDRRRITLQWQASADAKGYILRWGVTAEKLYNATVIYDNKFEGRIFNSAQDYYFSVEAFNENGHSKQSKKLLHIE
ncbi:family 43 glycosylhydrolase [Sphingobacterium sp. GVS05A]|uniref:family 43 glycosylhydrolase n=1 Tax=Sphingobacterium sp. GVS05A TaxID=2862679 RepID=UPI001CBE4310|nr:family 43 glycosylhydrolase [Sphingobacterium sp. GVS05A]